jgi:integrase
MTALPKYDTDNVINLSVVNGKLFKKEEVRYNKDGSVDKRHCNKVAGVSTEVYPFNTEEEIKAMIDSFNKRIDEAPDENKRQIACRNKMLFLIGINISLRASDLVTLKWNFFFDNNGNFKDFYTLQPKKTRKQKKFVKLFFNQAVKKAITDYVEEYHVQDMNEYLFKSRKGDKAITEISLWRIIVDTAKDAGIEKNVGSHSLRKTFGFWAWHNAEDKNKALVTLQMLFNHSDTSTTLKYIGILNSEIEDMFNSIDLGIDYL